MSHGLRKVKTSKSCHQSEGLENSTLACIAEHISSRTINPTKLNTPLRQSEEGTRKIPTSHSPQQALMSSRRCRSGSKSPLCTRVFNNVWPVRPLMVCRWPSSSMAVISSMRSDTLADAALAVVCVVCTAAVAAYLACGMRRCTYLRVAAIAIAMALQLLRRHKPKEQQREEQEESFFL